MISILEVIRTGLGKRIAIPHCSIVSISSFILFLKGIHFRDLDSFSGLNLLVLDLFLSKGF